MLLHTSCMVQMSHKGSMLKTFSATFAAKNLVLCLLKKSIKSVHLCMSCCLIYSKLHDALNLKGENHSPKSFPINFRGSGQPLSLAGLRHRRFAGDSVSGRRTSIHSLPPLGGGDLTYVRDRRCLMEYEQFLMLKLRIAPLANSHHFSNQSSEQTCHDQST